MPNWPPCHCFSIDAVISIGCCALLKLPLVSCTCVTPVPGALSLYSTCHVVGVLSTRRAFIISMTLSSDWFECRAARWALICCVLLKPPFVRCICVTPVPGAPSLYIPCHVVGLLSTRRAFIFSSTLSSDWFGCRAARWALIFRAVHIASLHMLATRMTS